MSCSTPGIKDLRMRTRIPKRYTILISRTGSAPITLTFNRFFFMGLLGLAIAIPVGSVGKFVHTYVQKNNSLIQQNHALSREAAQILEQVEGLKSEIEGLQERAGILDEEISSETEPVSRRSQGGIPTPIEASALLKAARSQIPRLTTTLKGQVRPALEKTLEREEALPEGIPLKGDFDTSSDFGLRRNPFGGGYEFHNGLDFKGPYGAPIFVTASGVVEQAGFSRGYGYHVIVDHGYGYRTLYAHMSKIEVKTGDAIDRDSVVGYLGNTGRSTGPHLHYTIYRSGTAVDPEDYLD
jgi:murein DD-endopeptidase MepM/ murein hydrolase activator NlpD